MKRLITSIIGLMLALLLACPASVLAEEEGTEALASGMQTQSTESGMLRVYLKSLGDKARLNITLEGSYSLGGDTAMRLRSGSRVTVFMEGDSLWLDCGGISIGTGETLTLTRHQTDGQNGLYIDGSQRGGLYCGSLEIRIKNGALMPILIIPIEEYLKGVVPYEMSDSFPLEALKAQAVAARTYALRRRADRSGEIYDVVDTTADQVFFGYNAEYANAIEAVEATRGLCACYEGGYATCYYTATNGGQTALAGDILSSSEADAYLDIREDPYDLENPSSPVSTLAFEKDLSDAPQKLKDWLCAAAAEQLSALGYSDESGDIAIARVISIEGIDPKSTAPSRDYQSMRFTYTVQARPMVPVYEKAPLSETVFHIFTGTPIEREIIGYEPDDWESVEAEFVCDISVYDQLKDELGLKISNIDCELATVIEEEDLFIIQLRRYGHGVGMSQRGAQIMASNYGMSFLDILAFYYPGLTIEEMSLDDETAAPLGTLSSLRSDADILGAPNEGEYLATVSLSTTASTLNLRAAPSTDAEVIAVLTGNSQVIVMDEQDGWAHVRAVAGEGYVAAQYLKS